jgi:hypothetical protein
MDKLETHVRPHSLLRPIAGRIGRSMVAAALQRPKGQPARGVVLLGHEDPAHETGLLFTTVDPDDLLFKGLQGPSMWGVTVHPEIKALSGPVGTSIIEDIGGNGQLVDGADVQNSFTIAVRQGRPGEPDQINGLLMEPIRVSANPPT